MMIESKAARWMLAFMAVITVLVLGIAGAVVATFQIASRTEANLRATERAAREAEQASQEAEKAGEEAAAGTDQSQRNETLLRIVLAITGCTVDDTPEACAQRVGTASQAEGNRRIVEVDCRIRRALAGQPPPEGNVCIP